MGVFVGVLVRVGVLVFVNVAVGVNVGGGIVGVGTGVTGPYWTKTVSVLPVLATVVTDRPASGSPTREDTSLHAPSQ